MKSLPIFALVLLFAGAAPAQTPPTPDAVTADPAHHHVVLENEHVRIFRVLASPGATSAMHRHPLTAIVSLDRARLEMTGPDGASSTFDLHPGQVEWLDNVTHSWRLLSGEGHVVGIEVKAAPAGAPANLPALPATDATVADPVHHQVKFENAHIRVFEAHAAPGARSPMHTHPQMVLVSLGTARFLLDPGDGRSGIFDFHPGQVLWIDGTRHAWELLAGEARIIAVEVKAARARP